MAQVVENLLYKNEALSSNPSPPNQKKKKKEKVNMYLKFFINNLKDIPSSFKWYSVSHSLRDYFQFMDRLLLL
jgi:uncharacterized protein YsxB (DUF464 family)